MTTKKPSLRTVIKDYLGILPESSLDYKTLQDMIKDGAVDSAFSYVKNMTEFEMIRWGPLSDTQTWPEFQALLNEGILSLEHDSLGELLQTANFYSSDDTVQEELYKYICEDGNNSNLQIAVENEKVYKNSLQTLRKLNINPAKQQPFLAQSGVTMRTLVDFVSKWWNTGGHKTNCWNPDYAKPLKSDEFYNFIIKNKSQH